MITNCLDKALHVRHGAILGVSEILIGLSGNSYLNKRETLDKAYKQLSVKEIQLIADSDYRQRFLEQYQHLSTQDYLPVHLSPLMRTTVKDIIRKVEANRLYRGKGGEIMRQGVCHLIRAMAIARVDIVEEKVYLFEHLNENFKHPNNEIQEEATRAFQAYCEAYMNPVVEEGDKVLVELRKMLKPSAVEENVALTRGYNMAFGVMSRALFERMSPEIYDTLLRNSVPKGKESDDAETRKAAIHSLIQAVRTCGMQNMDTQILKDIVETFYKGMNDY